MEISRRYIQLQKYGISRYRYMELQYFCLQYGEMRRDGGKTNQRDIQMIEDTVQEVAGLLYDCLLKNITEGVRWEEIGAPCGRQQFYNMRRMFFVLLSAKQKNRTLSER